MRIDPPPEPGTRYERAGNVVRALGTTNAVVFAHFTVENADAAVAEQVAFFQSAAVDPMVAGRPSAGGTLEWKVYGHDRPPDLGTRLAAAGFEPEEPETLMVFDLREQLHGDRRAADPAIVIRRIVDASGLAEAVHAAATAFGRDAAWQADRIERDGARLADTAYALYAAYAGGRPVASARTEFPPGRSFAGLWGGGTVAEYRGRGIYRALVGIRADEARRRGYRYLRVDARETSRPIIERLGFVALTGIVEWRRRLPPP